MDSSSSKLRKINSRSEKEAHTQRQALLTELAGQQLPALANHILTSANTTGTIDNFVGEVQLPLGLAGPLQINGKHAKGSYHFPLATCEGALVASVNRGCKALEYATVTLIKDAQTRAPLLCAKSARDALDVQAYVNKQKDHLKSIAEATSSHLTLQRIETFIEGRLVWIRLEASTEEAMGMNMTTIAADAIARDIAKATGAQFISVSGNLCSDKKPSASSKLLGRGKSVVAEGTLSRERVLEVLKTTPEKIVRLNTLKNMAGSALAGSVGHNAHHANIVAAIYLATGQDAGHITEGSLGTTHAEVQEDGGLSISVTLPCLQTGIIGGGTQLPAARDCLTLLGLINNKEPVKGGAQALAEIIAAAVLAGELSLLAAEAEHHLVDAHTRLNRRNR